MKTLIDKLLLTVVAAAALLLMVIVVATSRPVETGPTSPNQATTPIEAAPIAITPLDASVAETNPVPANEVALPGEVAAPSMAIPPHPLVDEFWDGKSMFMVSYSAGSQLEDPQANDGHQRSNNMPRKVPDDLPGQGLFLVAQPEVKTTSLFRRGMQLLLVNRTGQTQQFNSHGSELPIRQEAQDDVGQWHPIEFHSPWLCGNSCYNVFLKPGYCWAFPAPRYQGPLKTKLRFTMNLDDGSQIHSNEFEGSVNLEQFIYPGQLLN